MEAVKILYSIVQFSPFPDRFEYVNVGVIVFDAARKRLSIKLSNDFSRVRKFFGDINAIFLKSALHDFSERVSLRFHKSDMSSQSQIEEFNSKRADLFRLTSLNAVAGSDVDSIADKLFGELVVWEAHPRKIERINTLLTSAFREAGVLSLLDRRPEPIHLEQYGVTLQADYGYQNGVYNLIDAARFDNPQRGLAEAGKRVLEGKALSEMIGKRLIVVGDFGNQPDRFVDNLREDFEKVGSKLFRLEEVDELSAEIRRTAH
ncbi:DUF3037 domain-containing protein [Agrobacterium sp. RAC06]|uniref:DUF3037 domain-containing protein n=1 Tax=Agrobacterium sp. RAC06 TaxID=1842536 RepID=UPI00083E69E5|nr:DUF3037 domain-containing protein [Agrobacterium sp. RAC06]AOG09382.1 hypothetical protein BSY240_4308 [Agrobacterium sp. RAC06]